MLVWLLAKSRLDKPGLCKSQDVTRKFPCKSVYAPSSETVVSMQYLYQYTVKKVIDFPVPSWDVTFQTFPGSELF